MDQQKFVQLLESVLEPDTERLKTATSTLKESYYTSPASLSMLLQLLTSHQSPTLRHLAAIEARSLVPKHWSSLPAEHKPQIRNQLLQAALNEQNALVRHSSARVISAIAAIDLADGEWTDLPGFLQHAASSTETRQRELGVYVLFTILETMGDEFAPNFHELFTLFRNTIRDPDSVEVRVNTMLALSKMALVLDADEDTASVGSFQEVVPSMVAVLKECIDAEDEDRTLQAFEVFQTLLDCDSHLLAPHFKDLVQFMINIAEQTEIADDSRTQALSFLMLCVKYRKLKIQGMKLGEQLTLKSLQIVTELGDSAPDEEEVTPASSALGLLDLLAASLPPSQVIVPLLHALGHYVNNVLPEYRRAGILALGWCVEGAPDFIATQLGEIMPLVLRLLEDEDSGVRLAALQSVARLGGDLAEDLGKEHAKLIPALVKTLDMAMQGLTGNEKGTYLLLIRASCNAIDPLIEGLETKDVAHYVPELIPRLSRLFAHPDFKVKVAAIGAVGSIAASAELAFLPFFEATMNTLSEYVTIKDSADDLDLRAAATDAMGSMAGAVGPEPFRPYVQPLMQASEEGLHLGNPKLRESSYIFWSTMAKVYELDFRPFLGGVVKGLLDSLQQEESDLEVELGEEAQDLLGTEITIAGQKLKVSASENDGKITMKKLGEVARSGDEQDDGIVEGNADDDAWDELSPVTAVALEKEIAVDVIGDILTHTRKEYLPYLEKTIETVMPMVEHPYEGVRKMAIGTLYRAYAALWALAEEGEAGNMEKWQPGLPLKVQPTTELVKLGNMIMAATLAVWQDEQDRATVTDINRNVAATLKLCGPALIHDASVLEGVTTIIVMLITKKHLCQQDLDGDDDFDLQESSEYDWLVIDTALDVIIGLSVALGETFGQLWKVFEKIILKYAGSSEAIERSTAVGTIAECTKNMGRTVTPYTSSLLKLLLHRLSDEDPETKSNAAFAIGLLCEASGSDREILKAYGTILGKLEPLLQTQEARLLDNAAGCVSRMIMKHKQHIPTEEVLPALIQLLPLKMDYEENEPIFKMIIKLYQSNDDTIRTLTPRLVPIFAHVLSPPAEQLTGEVREQLVELVTYLYKQQPSLIQGHEVLMSAVRT